MASMTEPRVEVGVCDLGNVFIFHFAEEDPYSGKPTNETWQVRAGNHTVATVDSEDKANRIAAALCGHERLANEPADAPSEEMEKYAEAVRRKVSKR